MESKTQNTGPVPSHNVEQAIAHLRAGGRLVVPSVTRWIILDAKTLAKFEKADAWLIREDGDGYRLRQGKGSVYVFPGQLRYCA